MGNKPHPTIHIAYGDQEADIDVKIAPLIDAMWHAGIETSQCCEDSPPGWVWVEFGSSFALENFLSIVGDYDDTLGSLHDRMLHGYDRIGRPRVRQWRYETIIHDWAVEEVELETGEIQEICSRPPDFVVLISVSFPQEDLPEVLERINRFNSASGSPGSDTSSP